MDLNIAKELVELKKMSIGALRVRYTELFGDATNVRNRDWLIRKILWRLQANAEGDISERARKRALELANDSDLRMSPPRETTTVSTATGFQNKLDKRLPMPGSTITRIYKGQTLEVIVRDVGFEFEGERFKSLSAVAEKITGSHCNGYHFFKIKKTMRQ